MRVLILTMKRQGTPLSKDIEASSAWHQPKLGGRREEVKAVNPEAASLSEFIRQQVRSCPSTWMLIFDLDSTIFNTRYRTKKIFAQWASQPEALAQYPLLCEQIQRWLCQTSPCTEIYDPIAFISHHIAQPIDPASPVATALRNFWTERFFHGHYLQWDQPYPRSCELIAELYTLGCAVTYLTARNQQRLLGGTLLSLQQHGLPIPTEPQGGLIMKAQPAMPDGEYKIRALGHLSATASSRRLMFIDNEPGIVAWAHAQFPFIKTHLYRSVHSGTFPVSQLPAELQDQSFARW